MTEADFLKEFIDWAQAQGKLTARDFDDFVRERECRRQAVDWVHESFKGRF